MIGNKPSIYNQPSVYNQGGGDIIGPEIDGVKYPITRIGNQIWITQNIAASWPGLLDFSGSIYDNDTSPRSVYYNNQPNFFGKYGCRFGRLYNGFAVDYIADPNNGILPDGWRIPSKNDFDILISYLGGISDAGDKLKSIGFWTAQIYTDEFKFNAVPTGWFEKDNGNYKNLSNYTRLWTTTMDSSSKYYLQINPSPSPSAEYNTYSRNGLRLGASIRVMMDA